MDAYLLPALDGADAVVEEAIAVLKLGIVLVVVRFSLTTKMPAPL